MRIYDPYEKTEYLLLDISSLGICYLILNYMINKTFVQKIISIDSFSKKTKTTVDMYNMEMYTVILSNIMYYNCFLIIFNFLNLNTKILHWAIIIAAIMFSLILNYFYKKIDEDMKNNEEIEKE